jgi:hypothetical protein
MSSWKPYVVSTETPFFEKAFREIIKHANTQYPKEEIDVNIQGTKYLFKFQWQSDKICGIDVFIEIFDENEITK